MKNMKTRNRVGIAMGDPADVSSNILHVGKHPFTPTLGQKRVYHDLDKKKLWKSPYNESNYKSSNSRFELELSMF